MNLFKIISLQTISTFLFVSSILHAASCEEKALQILDNSRQRNFLSFEQAMERAIAYSPSLRSADLEVDVQEGEALQATLLPNPEFTANFDRFGGTNNFNNFDEAEFTYSITQLVELGGKRGARACLGERLIESANWNKKIVAWNLHLDLTEAFINVAAAQERLRLAIEKKKHDEDVLHAVTQKVEAGKVPETQKHRAEINLAKSQHSLTHAFRQFCIAKNSLAVFWGTCPDF